MVGFLSHKNEWFFMNFSQYTFEKLIRTLMNSPYDILWET